MWTGQEWHCWNVNLIILRIIYLCNFLLGVIRFFFLIYTTVSYSPNCFSTKRTTITNFLSEKQTRQARCLFLPSLSPVSTSSMCTTFLSTVTRACGMLWSSGSAACQTTVVARCWACPRAQQSSALAALRQLRVPASEWKMRMCVATESASPSPRGPEMMQVLNLCFSLSPITYLRHCPRPIKTRIQCSLLPPPYPPSPSCRWRSPGHPEGHGEQPARATLQAQCLNGPTAPGGGAVGLPVVLQPSPIRSADSSVWSSACFPSIALCPCLGCFVNHSSFFHPQSLSNCCFD